MHKYFISFIGTDVPTGCSFYGNNIYKMNYKIDDNEHISEIEEKIETQFHMVNVIILNFKYLGEI